MQDFWFNATSAMLIDHCGDTTSGNTIPTTLPVPVQKSRYIASALDDTGVWYHDVNHTHWIKIDLDIPHYITMIRGILNANTNVQHVQFYVGNDWTALGSPVLDVPLWQSQTPDGNGNLALACTPKIGRFILIEILSTTDGNNYLRWSG